MGPVYPDGTPLGVSWLTHVLARLLQFAAGVSRLWGDRALSHSAHPFWEQAHTFKDRHDNPTDTHRRSFSARVG